MQKIILWQLSFSLDENTSTQLSKDKKQLKDYIVKLVEDFYSPIPEMIGNTELEDLMGTHSLTMIQFQQKSFKIILELRWLVMHCIQ
jgi:hypothetical protein